jgi:hypothetical protein
MNEEITAQFSNDLDPAENILWCDKPFPGLLFDRKDIGFFVPIRSYILLIPVILIINTQSEVTLLELGIIVMIISIIGIPVFASLFNKLVVEPRKRKNTIYAITSQRIYIKSDLPNGNIKSINLNSIKKIGMNLYKNGKGNILLGDEIEETWFDKDIVTKFYFSKRKKDGVILELVNDASDVFNLLNKLIWKKKNDWPLKNEMNILQ